MSYKSDLKTAAGKIIPILKKMDVEKRYLRFDGTPEVPDRFYPPSQSDSKFQAEQALGDWAEDTLLAAINGAENDIWASHYGDNSKLFAEDEGFREEFIQGIKDTFTFGKRADLLLFDRKIGAPDDLTKLKHEDRSSFVVKSIGAIEVRSSRLTSRKYIDYQEQRKLQGAKPASMVPNFTIKVEDLVKVFLWSYINNKPQAYVQVFFDDLYGISFDKVLCYINSSKNLRVEKYKRSAKTTIMIPITEGTSVGSVTALPTFSVVHNVTRNGRHDIFARPNEGKIEIDAKSLSGLLE